MEEVATPFLKRRIVTYTLLEDTLLCLHNLAKE